MAAARSQLLEHVNIHIQSEVETAQKYTLSTCIAAFDADADIPLPRLVFFGVGAGDAVPRLRLPAILLGRRLRGFGNCHVSVSRNLFL